MKTIRESHIISLRAIEMSKYFDVCNSTRKKDTIYKLVYMSAINAYDKALGEPTTFPDDI